MRSKPRLNPWLAVLCALSLSLPALHAEESCVAAQPIERAYGATPVTAYMIAVLKPEALIGWNFEPPAPLRGFVSEDVFKRPVVGGWFGQGKTPNIEMLVALKPQISLTSAVTVSLDRSLPMLQKLGLATCNLTLDTVQDYPAAFRRGGQALGVSERGEQLARMADGLLAAHQQAKARFVSPKPRLYYAQDPDGLATECAGSVHAEVLELAGGENVHVCPKNALADRFGKVRIDFEQLLRYEPDWIVTQEAAFVQRIASEPRWQNLRAVREGRVLLAPQVPFRWLDRPPSFMRLLAMHWLADNIQPKPYVLDVNKATRDFLALYFQRQLDEDEVQRILHPR